MNIVQVYTLWTCPSLLPSVTTPPAVIPKLLGGADLMAPGGMATLLEYQH
jgi:translation initiation factor 2D